MDTEHHKNQNANIFRCEEEFIIIYKTAFKVHVCKYLSNYYVHTLCPVSFLYIIKEPLDKDIDEETDENLISFVTEGFTETTTHDTTTLSKCS